MATFAPKIYQAQVLESIQAYFDACQEQPSASQAFTRTTEKLWGHGSSFHALTDFPENMPYFCLRVPTGGGKTWIAAKSVALINTRLLRVEHSLILWLVPSKPIREQTLFALKDPRHPYGAALKDSGPVTVLDLAEAKSVTRATLDTSTVVIVATRQAFQVDDEESRKVYESNGALMHHFDGLTAGQRAHLLRTGDEVDPSVPYSLANVLRLRRPFVIVDEAHNSRTELAFETLERFRPSGIMELTATPDMQRTPSNVLHSVSAAELKAEEMIKLPVVLETEPNWHQCLADAIARRNELQQVADDDRSTGAPYLRPIVLIQAEPRRQGSETLDVDHVRKELVDNHRIPADEIVVATSEERGLEEIGERYEKGISDERCPVRFVITQRALAEGWDCPFAYVLVSMASLKSATAVEQLLGRILRQPDARHRQSRLLNQSYAFVVSRSFAETAGALRDRLVQGAGFERRDAAQFVAAARPEQRRLDMDGGSGWSLVKPVVVKLAEQPDLPRLPERLREKLRWNEMEGSLTISRPLTEEESDRVVGVVSGKVAQASVAKAAEESRLAAEFFQTPAEKGDVLSVPQIVLRIQGELTLFDDPEALEYPWDLKHYEAAPNEAEVANLGSALKVAEGGEIDVDASSGKVVHRFIADLQRDLGLAYRPDHWDEVKLAAWISKNVPEPSLTHASKVAFIAAWVRHLLLLPGFDLARANQQKFFIRNLLERRIKDLRAKALRAAYQQSLFGEGRESRVAVSDEYSFMYNPQVYSPSRDYDGRFGAFEFRRHYYGRIGDFDSKAEFLCAQWLDMQAQRDRIEYWVRNLARKEGCSFFLQKADGRFYPDFVCKLPSGTILLVEYKGDRWESAEDDRRIGGLWEELSGGKGRFVMARDQRWDLIEAKLA